MDGRAATAPAHDCGSSGIAGVRTVVVPVLGVPVAVVDCRADS